MRKEAVKLITNIMYEGKLIFDLYESLGCPTDGQAYKDFIFDVTDLFVRGKLPNHNMQFFLDWLFDQRGNNLPKQSSGSLYTALFDLDGFISGVESRLGDDLTEEEDEFAQKVFEGLFVY